MADGIARHWAAKLGIHGEIEFDSAGTHAYHDGEAPDPRAQRAAKRRGYEISRLRARPVVAQDFERFDLIVAMDRGHLVWLRRECPPEYHAKLVMFLSYAERFADGDVPDPYYGGEEGFERVLDMCEDAVQGILDKFR
ncbi:MAG: protein tyrosine phosphatase [Rhodocyclales bacterium]|nr:protein tyrosine phosphatase [Rhodocyclales bacterium]